MRGRHLGLELDLLGEYWMFSKRHIRYVPIFISIYAYSLSAWKRTRPLRAAYALTQAIDDLLDKDRFCPREPEDEVREILAGTLPQARLSRIARFVLPHLGACGALVDFERLVESMVFDRQRVREGLRLTQKELQAHHQQVFQCSANVALKICGFELRASDVPGVIDQLCWVSPMRDLREDLRAGLNNLPLEIWNPEKSEAADAAAALQNPRVKQWLSAEYTNMLAAVERTTPELQRVQGLSGAFGFRIFHRLLSSYAHKYPRQYPEVFE